MQESPGARSSVYRHAVIERKYNTKSSWAESEKSNIGQRTDRDARSQPTSIVWHALTQSLPAVERLLDMTCPPERQYWQKKRDRADQDYIFFGARKLSQECRSKLQADCNREQKRDELGHPRRIGQNPGDSKNKNAYPNCPHGRMTSGGEGA